MVEGAGRLAGSTACHTGHGDAGQLAGSTAGHTGHGARSPCTAPALRLVACLHSGVDAVKFASALSQQSSTTGYGGEVIRKRPEGADALNRCAGLQRNDSSLN